MATLSRVLLPLLVFSESFISILSLGVGINYGQLGNNLPPPSQVVSLIQSLNISRVKLYDANPAVLSAFANTDVEFVIAIDNVQLQNMTDPTLAKMWIQQWVQPYTSQTKIKCITIGNEVLSGNNTQWKSYLLPAMQTVNGALINLGLSKDIYVTTAHSYQILAISFPPSAGTFRQDLVQYIQGILNFHSQTNSPFLINAYPFFAYKDNPDEIPLNYTLFQPSPGMTDPSTNLHYDNMLYAQIDAVYSAIKRLGYTNIQVKVSETGWPSKGGPDEAGATPENARLYNGNLLRRIEQNNGTPANPTVPVDVYIFALFNENQKPGLVSERNYGLFYPDESPVYNIGLQGSNNLPMMEYSSCKKTVRVMWSLNLLLIIPIALLICSL